MLGNEGNFLSKTPYSGNDSVMIGDGKLLEISDRGTVQVNIDQGHVLKNVLYVPALQKSLLSIILLKIITVHLSLMQLLL